MSADAQIEMHAPAAATQMKRQETGVATSLEMFDCLKSAREWAVSVTGVRIINTVIMLICMISVGMSIYSYVQIGSASSGLGTLRDAWSAVPISNIAFVAAGASCPAGTYAWNTDYNSLSGNPGKALLYPSVPTYPGSSAGCSCPASPNPVITSVACTQAQITSGCTTIAAIGSSSMNSFKGVQLCLSFYTDRSMASSTRSRATYRGTGTGSAQCPTGWQACQANGVATSAAITGLQSNTEVTCTVAGLSCPVTAFNIASAPLGGNWACSAVASTSMYGCVQRNGISIFSNFSNPLIALGVTQGVVCLADPTNGKKDDSDIRTATISGCGSIDSAFDTMASITPAAEYSGNNIMSSAVANAFFSWDTAAIHQFNLVARPEDNWVSTCPVTRDTMSQLTIDNSTLRSILLILLAINIIDALVVDGFCGSYTCYFVGIEWPTEDDKHNGHRRFRNMQRLMQLFTLATILVKLILVIYVIKMANDAYTSFSNVSSFSPGISGYTNGCSGQPTLGASLDSSLLSLKSYMYSILSSNIFNVIWFFVSIVRKILAIIAYSHAGQLHNTGEELKCGSFICWE